MQRCRAEPCSGRLLWLGSSNPTIMPPKGTLPRRAPAPPRLGGLSVINCAHRSTRQCNIGGTSACSQVGYQKSCIRCTQVAWAGPFCNSFVSRRWSAACRHYVVHSLERNNLHMSCRRNHGANNLAMGRSGVEEPQMDAAPAPALVAPPQSEAMSARAAVAQHPAGNSNEQEGVPPEPAAAGARNNPNGPATASVVETLPPLLAGKPPMPHQTQTTKCEKAHVVRTHPARRSFMVSQSALTVIISLNKQSQNQKSNAIWQIYCPWLRMRVVAQACCTGH